MGSKMHLRPPDPFLGGGSIVVDLLFIVAPIVCVFFVLVCFTVLSLLPTFASISMRRER